jgi:preprotein translocase subunit YajC
MNLNLLQNVILAADAPGAPTPMQDIPSPTGQLLKGILPIVMIMVVFYVLLIRPQSRKAKELAEVIKTMKPGDKVVTSSGIKGIVVSVKDDSVTIRSADTKLEILKSAVSEIRERAGEAAAGETKQLS